MSKFSEMLANSPSERIETKYDLTIEQIMEMDEYRARGEISPLESSLTSLADLVKKAGRYGRMAEIYLRENNFPKYMKMRSDLTLWEKLAEIPDRVEALKAEYRANYVKPKTKDYLELVTHRRMFDSMVEEQVFEQIIKPFAE